MDQKLIKKWLKEGIITNEQSQKMLKDIAKLKKEVRSNAFIIAISTIGAILLGVGAILFIASNWQEIPSIGKTLILLGSTFGAYYAGYVFKYQKANLPFVGASLLFLATLLFGATVILIAQIYNINANNHVLVLLWLLGILPLMYALRSTPIAGLASLLFFLWAGLFFSLDGRRWFFDIVSPVNCVLFILGAVMLFATGGLHYFKQGLENIARMFRISSLKVLMFFLFLLTFEAFSKASTHFLRRHDQLPGQLIVGIMLFALIAMLITLLNWAINRSEKLSKIEGPISIGMIGLALIFFSFPSTTAIYVFIFNLVMAGMIGVFLWAGYDREDMKLVNMGTFWLSVFIIGRYFDFFWDLLPRSLFFIAGGLILVFGGIALEKKRRGLKQHFGAQNG